MSVVLGILFLVGAIGALIVVGIAMIPFFLGFLLTFLATGVWQHLTGTSIAFGSEQFWWIYAACTVLCFAVLNSGKRS